MVFRPKLAILGVVALAVSLLVATPGGALAASGDRHVLPGTKPDWTAKAAKAGGVPGAQRLSAKVWLEPNNSAALDALAAAVSDPANAQYGQYITADQYDATFAPTADQVAAVTGWLKGSGLRVDSVGEGNAYLSVSGTASALNAAFGTQLALYKVNGKIEQAPSADISVPTSLAGLITAVSGLVTLGHRTAPADLGAPAGFRNATPCSSYYGQQMATTLPQFNGQTLPYAPCGYTPSQFRSTYGAGNGRNDGRGQTVAITDAFDASALLSDANQYSTNRGDRPFARGQFSDRSFPEPPASDSRVGDCGGNGWYGEQTLDIEAVHGMAPAANVIYYGASSCYDDDLLASLNRAVHENKASIVTNSWGEPTFVVLCDANGQNCQLYSTIDKQLVNAYEHIFKRGAAQGIGFYFSSGDNGDELAAWGYKHPDFPTGDPWVTAVGGTALAIGSNGHRIFETGWGTSQWRSTDGYQTWNANVAPFQYGAGGGYSEVFPEPGYQRRVVGSDPTGGRAVPDIGLDGDPTTGMLVGETQDFGSEGVHYGEYRIGGTSLSSPLFAGLQADVQEGHNRIGFANPLIYSLFAKHVYFDVTPQGDAGNIRADFKNGVDSSGGIRYSVRTFDQDSSLTTGPGWDDVTGVGAPTPAYIEAAERSLR